MKRLSLSLATVIALLATLSLAAACGGDDANGMGRSMGSGGMMNTTAPEGSITVNLTNWSVDPAKSEAKAGSVTFWAVHDMGHGGGHGNTEGGVTHDLQVMKKRDDGSFQLIGQVQGLTMGQAKELTLDLAPGDYELSCNVVEQIKGATVGHYAKGMKAPFKVTA